MLELASAHILVTFICSVAGAGGVISINMAGEEDISDVKAIIKNDSAFISIDDVLERLGIVLKDIDEETTSLCKDEICVLVQLNNEDNVLRDSERLLVNVELVAAALGSSVEWIIAGKSLRFVPKDQVTLDTVVKPGDVVPDFALPSIANGKMVSLSSFRGKRVLLFLWASW